MTVPFGFAFKPVDARQLRLGIEAALAAQARERALRDAEPQRRRICGGASPQSNAISGSRGPCSTPRINPCWPGLKPS